MSDVFLTKDFARDRWGRPLITVPGVDKPQPYARCSSFGSILENQSGLTTWKIRTALNGAIERPDLLAMMSASRGDDAKVRQLVDQISEAGGASKAANTGTAIHEVISQYNKGVLQLADVPVAFQNHVRLWAQALETHGYDIVPDLVETHLVNDLYRTAGSADAFLRRRSDGALVCVDVKTGKSISAKPIAYMVQLYLYATSVQYDVATGERADIDSVDLSTAIIAHLPADGSGCTFYEVNLADAKILADAARAVKDLEKQISSVAKIDAPVSRRDWLRERLRIIIDTHPDQVPRVRSLWPDGVGTLKSDDLSDADLSAIAGFFDRLEADLGIPFGSPDPAAKKRGVRKAKTDEQKVVEVFPEATLVDDVAPVDSAAMKRLQEHFDQLTEDQRRWVKARGEEAADAKVSFSIKGAKTVARYSKFRVCIGLAEWSDEDVARLLISKVNPKAKPHRALGALIGDLTHQQVVDLQQILDRLNNGEASITFDANTPVLVG